MSQTKLHVYCKHGFGLHPRGNFICIFRWCKQYFYFIRRRSWFWRRNYLFIRISIFKFEKKYNQSGSKNTQNMYHNTVQLLYRLALLVCVVSLLCDKQYIENMVKYGVYKLIKLPILVRITDSIRLYWKFWNSMINRNYRTWCKIYKIYPKHTQGSLGPYRDLKHTKITEKTSNALKIARQFQEPSVGNQKNVYRAVIDERR